MTTETTEAVNTIGATQLSIREKFGARLEAEYGVGEYRGFPLKLRRMRSNLLYIRGRMPLYFADIYRRAKQGEIAPSENPEMTDEELIQSEHFRREIIVDSCVEPRLALERSEAEEADYLLDEIPEDVQQFIYLYATRKVDFLASELSEAATAETLENFLPDGERTPELDNVG